MLLKLFYNLIIYYICNIFPYGNEIKHAISKPYFLDDYYELPDE